MLATFERIELLDQAENLSQMIIDSDVAENYYICLYKLQSNQEAQRKIRHFAKLKEQYEEVQRFGKYHPDYKKVMMEIRVAKREMDLDFHVAEFRKAENDLQDLLNHISVLIGGAVSRNVKVPTGNPFFDTSSSCGGSCGSGGSCGCSA
ncbi:YlbF family regulator [Neobacillus terrae]|uniref:YlbF family regulator n=1 Tax=Neobacillus terrae TaxID=3034837 RepID=UPI0014084033|nr:YlbF family regulator [Neobacillus terrae]NHM29670.1 YlbF family regulator [Neobacillus terrae]